MTITTFVFSVIASLIAGLFIEAVKYMISRRKNDRHAAGGH